MRLIFYVILIVSVPFILTAQYTESFDVPNKGILPYSGGSTSSQCPSNDPTTCDNFDFSGVDWTLGGNLSSIDQEGLYTTGGNLQFSDVDEMACWISPTLDISSAGTVTGVIKVEFVSGWDVSDFGYVEYSVDGGTYVKIGDVTCGNSAVNTFGDGCAIPAGIYTVNIPGLSGSTLDINVCFDSNVTSEIGYLQSVSVPEANVMILPVELISFKAQEKDKSILLDWSTALEVNNEKFEIEHSIDGKTFEKVGERNGNLTTDRISNYNFVHKSPAPGNNYYRLNQIDLDGQYEYSQIVSVRISRDKGLMSNFYPNPSRDGLLHLNFSTLEDSELKIAVYDVSGMHVMDKHIELIRGENKIDFDFSILDAGVYFTQTENLGNIEYQKFIVQH